MKKYFQFIAVMGIFGVLVLFRQLKGSDEAAPVIQPNAPSGQEQTITPQSSSGPNTSVVPTTPSTGRSSGKYKDGTYTGQAVNYIYGVMQVQAVVQGGKMTDVTVLQSPDDNPTSRSINAQSNVFLRQEALTAQSEQVDIVSGASDSSQAFKESLGSALAQAK